MKNTNFLSVLSVLPFLFLSCSKTAPVLSTFTLSEGDTLPQFTAMMSDKTIISAEEFKDTVGLVLIYDIDKPIETLNAVIPVDNLYKYYDQVFKFCCISVSESPSDTFWEQNSFSIPYADSYSGYSFSDNLNQSPVLLMVKDGIIEKIWSTKDMPSSEELRIYMEPFFHGVIIVFDDEEK